jgi:hypothetical protein
VACDQSFSLKRLRRQTLDCAGEMRAEGTRHAKRRKSEAAKASKGEGRLAKIALWTHCRKILGQWGRVVLGEVGFLVSPFA